MTGTGKAHTRIVYAAIGMVIGITLLLAGLIDTGIAPSSSPVIDGPSAPANPPQPQVQDAALHRHQAPTIQPEEWNESAEPPDWEGPSFTVTARFRVHPAGAAEEGDFTCGHPVALWADGAYVAHTDPPGLRLPANARTVVFKALGYRPVSREVPPAHDGTVDFGDIVLEPDAAVRVRLSGAPVDGGEVRFVVGRMPTFPYAQAIRLVTGGAAEAVLPAPSGEWLQVTGFTRPTSASNEWFAVDRGCIALRTGETGSVELGPLPGARVTILVQGPSSTLLPNLTVRLSRPSQRGLSDAHGNAATSPDAQGRAVFRVPPDLYEITVASGHGIWPLTASDGTGTLPTLTEGAVVAMTPIQPLVGVIVRRNGAPVASLFSLRGRPCPGPLQQPAHCHVLARSEVQAARELNFWTEDSGPCAITEAELHPGTDILYVDTDQARAYARLEVSTTLPPEYYSALAIVAEPLTGGAPLRIGGNKSPFQAVLPGGSYRLRWTCNGAPIAVIDDHLQLAPGEHRELTATAPSLQRWDVQIVDHGQPTSGPPGPLSGIVVLRFGDLWSSGGGPVGGTAPVLAPIAWRPAAMAEIFVGTMKMMVPAEVKRLDEQRRTFAVEHSLTLADCVGLTSRGLGSGKREIWLSTLMTDNKLPAWLGPNAVVPMLPGSERTGCLLEQVDNERQITNWFTIRHGCREVRLEPLGRWVTVRLEQPTTCTVQVEGWPGIDPQNVGRVQKGPCEFRIFVADGTRAVRVGTPLGVSTFAPDLTEIVVR